MSKLFIFILFVVALFSVIFYQFSFAEKNKIISYTCRDTVASFCQVNICGNCEYAGAKMGVGCDLMFDTNSYFHRAGSCAFTEKSLCEWKKTWRTDICAQARSIDSSIKIKLKINKINVYGLNYLYVKP